LLKSPNIVEAVSCDLVDMSLNCQLGVQHDTCLVADNNVIVDLQQAIRGGYLLEVAAGTEPDKFLFRGSTENAGLGFWKMTDQIAGLENAGP